MRRNSARPYDVPTTRNPFGRRHWTAPGCRWAQRSHHRTNGLPIGEAVGLADAAGWAPVYLVTWWLPAAPGARASTARVGLTYAGQEIHVGTSDPSHGDWGRATGDVRTVGWLTPEDADRSFACDVGGLRALHLSHECGERRSPLHPDVCTHEMSEGLFDPDWRP